VSKQRRLSVRQMAAQLESARSSALSSSSSGGPSSSSRSHWPSAAAPSLPPLPREPPRPMRDHGPRQSSNVPDETLLPLAVGQAFAWKEWEERENTYQRDQELAKRLQAEQEVNTRTHHERRTVSQQSDERLAHMLEKEEKHSSEYHSSNRTRRLTSPREDERNANDAAIAELLQAEEVADARTRARSHRHIH